jgi:predicted O-methyltransferase YrrM
VRRPQLEPGSSLVAAGYRLVLARALPELTGREDEASRALARALRTAALGRFPAEERAWIERIEAARRRIPASAVDVAGAAANGEAPRPVDDHLEEASQACLWMSLPPALGRFLMRLVRELAPRSCLELGTGFGVSSSYQAAALELNGSGRMTSLDVEDMVAIARPGLGRLGLGDRVELLGGRIEETLASAAAGAAPIDYALLDADHTEAGTLDAFDAILPHLAPGAVVVLDDVNWTEGMRRAWVAIPDRPRVAATVGLHRLGIAVISERSAA